MRVRGKVGEPVDKGFPFTVCCLLFQMPEGHEREQHLLRLRRTLVEAAGTTVLTT